MTTCFTQDKLQQFGRLFSDAASTTLTELKRLQMCDIDYFRVFLTQT